MQNIFTEDPNDEQWQMLSNFIYPDNIKKFFKKRGIEDDISEENLELISASVIQAKEYFYAASLLSLNTSPLLLYYGTVNIMFAASLLISNQKPDTRNHGIEFHSPENPVKKLADIEFIPRFSTTHGGLFQFCNTFCPDIDVSCYGGNNKWTLLEILGSIPELKSEFEECYNTASYVIPLQIVKNQNDYVERINKSEFNNDNDIMIELSKILNFDKTYLKPNLNSAIFGHPYVILRRKIGSQDIHESSVFGQMFLSKYHLKEKKCITLPTIIYICMGLYTLGYLSRYRSDIWSPFVRSDSTGEKQIIEKFLKCCQRSIPNMILNCIYKTQFYFVREFQSRINLSEEITQDTIRKIVHEEIRKYQ
jgi:hypothetical protein